jgi:hypothetical protein
VRVDPLHLALDEDWQRLLDDALCLENPIEIIGHYLSPL